MKNLRKINIFNFATCSGQTWLSSTLPLSISSTVHSFTSFNFSLLTTSAWPLAVPLSRWSQQIKTLSLLMTTRPIPVRSCGAGVKDCRVKELDLFNLILILFHFILFYFVLFYFILIFLFLYLFFSSCLPCK